MALAMATNDYSIRAATLEDVRGLPAIERAAAVMFPADVLPAHLGAFAVSIADLTDAQHGGRLWVACADDGHVVGFAIAQVFEDAAYLEELDVHPDHGRRGLGRRLVEKVIAWARSEGYRAVLLDTFRNVPWNMPFYARMGFVELEDEEIPEAVRAIMQRTFAAGLDPANRVAMVYWVEREG